jgi:DNA-3-methyladenine glycosylase II
VRDVLRRRGRDRAGRAGGGVLEPLAQLRKADPVLRGLIDELGPLDEEKRRRGRPREAYGALVRSIVGQQLSTKAAATIYGRLIEMFDGRTPTPAELLAADPEKVRQAGLSRPKVSYLRSLAEHVESGELELAKLTKLPDEEVSAQLTAVKGLGQWTADMFLIFHLGRPDVLPVGDLGVRRAVERAYGLRKLPDAARLTKIAEPWRPNRSLASLYLWRSLDNVPG